MDDKSQIFISGAGGFIGGRIAEVLCLNKWRNVKAGVRSWASCTRIGTLPLYIEKVDLLNRDAVRRAVKDATHVIHCAYGSPEATVDGTRNLLENLDINKIERFVHLSSIEVYTDPKGTVDENWTCSPTGNAYGDSKLEAEKICLDYIEKRYPITILRLPIVYGPFSRNWTVNYGKMLISGELKVVEKFGEGKCNLLYIDDLVKAVMLSLKSDAAPGEIFNVNGPEILTWNQYFTKFAKSLDLPLPKQNKAQSTYVKTILYQPVRLLGGYLRDHHMEALKYIAQRISLADKVMRKTEKKLKNTMSHAELGMLVRDAEFSCVKAQRLIGYSPIFNVDKALSIIHEWMRLNGFLMEKQNKF